MERQTPVPAVITAAAFIARFCARSAGFPPLELWPTSTTVPDESLSTYERNCSSRIRLPQLFTRELLGENRTSGNRTACAHAGLVTSTVVVAVPVFRLSAAFAVMVTV